MEEDEPISRRRFRSRYIRRDLLAGRVFDSEGRRLVLLDYREVERRLMAREKKE